MPKSDKKIRPESAVPVLDHSETSDEYWLARTPTERLEHVEYLRRLKYGARATKRMQRILEIVEY